MSQSPPAKPQPVADTETTPYWQAAANGELKLQRCQNCGTLQALPRITCSSCRSSQLDWIRASGKGTVASYSWVERGPSKAFQQPYMLALIDLAEGVRLMLNIVGDDREATRIGDSVDIVFEARGDACQLPQARRSNDT